MWCDLLRISRVVLQELRSTIGMTMVMDLTKIHNKGRLSIECYDFRGGKVEHSRLIAEECVYQIGVTIPL